MDLVFLDFQGFARITNVAFLGYFFSRYTLYCCAQKRLDLQDLEASIKQSVPVAQSIKWMACICEGQGKGVDSSIILA